MIVTLDIMQEEIGRLDDYHAALISRKITDAEAIVIDYIKAESDAYENDDEVNDFPQVIAAAVIQVCKNLYERPDEDPISEGVKNLLYRQRDPALA